MPRPKPYRKALPVKALRQQHQPAHEAPLSAHNAIILERRYKAMCMRKDGVPMHKIAEMLGCGTETIKHDLQEVLGQTATALFENTEEARNLERSRYDALFARYQPLAEAGDKAAAMIVLQISKELRRMEALDKPEERRTEETGVRVYVGIDIDAV
jgi:hypothetical protein